MHRSRLWQCSVQGNKLDPLATLTTNALCRVRRDHGIPPEGRACGTPSPCALSIHILVGFFLYLSICLRKSGFSPFCTIMAPQFFLCCFFFLSLPAVYLSNPFIYLSSVYLPGISFNIYLCLFFSALSLLPLRITINLTIKSLPLSLLSLNKI